MNFRSEHQSSGAEPLVSVVLPFYNSAETLHSSVCSVLEQSYGNIELILVNDGSSDEAELSIAGLLSSDNRIRLFNISHAGVAEAFNYGIRTANGKYIARMDADDIMLPEKIRSQVNFLENNPGIGVVSCKVRHGGDPIRQEGYARHIEWINSLLTTEEIALNRFIDSPVCNPSVLFRRELVEIHGGALGGDFPEDYDMWLRWMDAGVLFAKIPESLFVWNDLATRLTRNDERYSAQAFERAKTKYLAEFIRRNNTSNRPLYLCGTGRITRKKSNYLLNCGMKIGGYLDIDPDKAGMQYNGIPVLAVNDLPDKFNSYVVSYVSVRGARKDLRKIFAEREMREGEDFVMAG